MFDTADGPVSLDDLSDGYQNVAAWVGDLLYRTTGAFDDFSNPLATRGLLLLDEIDLHLHVKWQRQLRQFIEDKLPKFQIVATTHSPMTAQQVGRGEVHVLARPTPEAAQKIRGYDIAPDRLGLHQLIEPFFDVETVDSARIAGLKDQYRFSTARNADPWMKSNGWKPCATSLPTFPRGTAERMQGHKLKL